MSGRLVRDVKERSERIGSWFMCILIVIPHEYLITKITVKTGYFPC